VPPRDIQDWAEPSVAKAGEARLISGVAPGGNRGHRGHPQHKKPGQDRRELADTLAVLAIDLDRSHVRYPSYVPQNASDE